MTLIEIDVRPSKIHGLGCFAKSNVAAGQLVWRFDESFDLTLTESRFANLPKEVIKNIRDFSYRSKATGDYILCADGSRFMNHSTSPNISCYNPSGSSDNTLECFAIREIHAGEEITCDYSEFDAES